MSATLLSPEEEAAVDAGFLELAGIPEDRPGDFRLLRSRDVARIFGIPVSETRYSVSPVAPPLRHGESKPPAGAQLSVDEHAGRRLTPSYVFGMTEAFVKTIRKYDKATLGRVLVAISDLSEAPTTVKGDTVKPLAGDMRGLWRYRVGDYRLVYRPDADNRRVLLLAFSPRDATYD